MTNPVLGFVSKPRGGLCDKPAPGSSQNPGTGFVSEPKRGVRGEPNSWVHLRTKDEGIFGLGGKKMRKNMPRVSASLLLPPTSPPKLPIVPLEKLGKSLKYLLFSCSTTRFGA
ncbi:hypothetical protein SLEP1_g15210 [Rubroshorea leprosula]|uniref:Uncharacterized protein n=1 Tax=Rubroshorea leprosula TaxID=152421 RepID=A0AAV5IVH7_9ROSI|nr:hypothetical protein SLEP1_g15210 [Rubroshorea leprosula]